MPFNGSGVFSIVNTFVSGTTIFSSPVNANFTDIATGLSTAVLKNGAQTVTADIPMASFGFTGLGKLSSQAVVTVASAATTDVLGAASLLVAISGTGAITSLGTGANTIKFVRATGAFTLTHNGTSLILPTASNIIAVSGDTFVVISDASSNARIYAYQRASGFSVISYPGYRNILRRNGGLEIWQRGAGGAAAIAAGAGGQTYAADGWYLSTGANEASVVSQQAGLTNGSQWCAKVLRNSGQTGVGAMFFGFPLDTDELYPLLGQFARLSLTLKAGANWSPSSGNLAVYLVVGTGTPVKFVLGTYAGSTTMFSTTQAITASAARYQFSTSAVVPTTTRQAEIGITWTPVGTAGADDSFSIDDVQLEIVPDASQGASPFEYLNFGEQLALCQRHYQKTFPYGTAPAQNAGQAGQASGIAGKAGAGNEWIFARFPVPLRAAPATPTLYNPSVGNAQVRDIGDAVDCSSSAANIPVALTSIEINATGNAGTTVGSQLGVHFIVDAGI